MSKRRIINNNNSSALRILVIDDEADMLENYRRLLERAGHECLGTDDPARLASLLERFQPHLVLTDLVMPGISGMDVLDRVKRFDEGLPVIILTGHGSIENAVEAMKRRADDYLTKPFSIDELLGKIEATMSRRLAAAPPGEVHSASPSDPGQQGQLGESSHDTWKHGIIGASAALTEVLDLARKVARTDVNVLVVGESGTGKELLARAIHQASPRNREIFVPVDCASLPEALLESELFGYRKGAFTGANADKMGLFEFAHKGSLFLDEIGELPTSLQAKLLRVLQERQFRPLGGRSQIDIDVRVIAATARDLEQASRDKTFRSDLYYRLNVVMLRLPPLRERREDIPLLANHFLGQFVRDNPCLGAKGLSSELFDILKAYDWPGNVRELQNVIEHAATLATQPTIQPGDLPPALRSMILGERPAKTAMLAAKDALVGDFERDYLIALLVEHQFNISKAAMAANCHRRTLYRMIHRHRLSIQTLEQGRRGVRATLAGSVASNV